MTGDPTPSQERPAGRPWFERLLLLLLALVFAAAFLALGAASWVSGEVALAVLGVIGALMTLWVGALSVRRG